MPLGIKNCLMKLPKTMIKTATFDKAQTKILMAACAAFSQKEQTFLTLRKLILTP
jgi:hypothetical protein